jgi:Domain of unknown function (DU1801)
MAENKTQPHDGSVEDFLNSVEDEQKRRDAFEVLALMKEVTGEAPKMWGPGIVGFGTYHYKYDSGREGDFLITGFSPRKAALTLYIMPGFRRYDEYMQKLGEFKTGKSCLYIKKLEHVDMDVLRKLVSESFGYMRQKYLE